MAGNHDTQQQQQQQLQDQAPESPDSLAATTSPPTANTITPLPPPPAPLRHLSSGPLQGSTSETPSHVSGVAQDYYSHSALLADEHFAATSWSPQSVNSSLRGGSVSESSRAPQSTQDQSQQHDPRQLQQEAATPGSKRKHPSVSIDPQLHSPNLALPMTGEEQQQQQQQQQAPKKQRRTSKAAKGRGNSVGDSEGDKQAEMFSDRPRLSEQEKKNNHIASEQKRRLAIREGFDRLTEIVPGLEGQGRSESIVLKKSVDHMREILQERQMLIERIQALGGEIPPELR